MRGEEGLPSLWKDPIPTISHTREQKTLSNRKLKISRRWTAWYATLWIPQAAISTSCGFWYFQTSWFLPISTWPTPKVDGRTLAPPYLSHMSKVRGEWDGSEMHARWEWDENATPRTRTGPPPMQVFVESTLGTWTPAQVNQNFELVRNKSNCIGSW
jgi:hypothetical protein